MRSEEGSATLDKAADLPYSDPMKVKDLFRLLNQLGWVEVRSRGSHHLFAHPNARRPVPVAVHGKEISDIMAKAILKQANDALNEE